MASSTATRLPCASFAESRKARSDLDARARCGSSWKPQGVGWRALNVGRSRCDAVVADVSRRVRAQQRSVSAARNAQQSSSTLGSECGTARSPSRVRRGRPSPRDMLRCDRSARRSAACALQAVSVTCIVAALLPRDAGRALDSGFAPPRPSIDRKPDVTMRGLRIRERSAARCGCDPGLTRTP